MNKSDYSFKDVMLALLLDGVDLEKLDLNEAIIYIAIPKTGYMYEGEEHVAFKTPDELASHLKNTMIKLGWSKTKVRFRVKDIYFPESERKEYYMQHFDKVSRIINEAVRKAGNEHHE